MPTYLSNLSTLLLELPFYLLTCILTLVENPPFCNYIFNYCSIINQVKNYMLWLETWITLFNINSWIVSSEWIVPFTCEEFEVFFILALLLSCSFFKNMFKFFFLLFIAFFLKIIQHIKVMWCQGKWTWITWRDKLMEFGSHHHTCLLQL